jgi:hypothetical protein
LARGAAPGSDMKLDFMNTASAFAIPPLLSNAHDE